MKNKINHFKEIVDNAWIKHSKDQFRFPTAQDIEILIQTCLMPLALKTQNDSFIFVYELKQEMHADLKYVESLEKEINELEPDKAEFSNMYDMILQECVSNEVMCMQRIITKLDKPSVVRQPNAQRIPKPSVLGVNHKTNVSRPQHRINQLKDKVLPKNSQVKLKKTQVEEHPRIPSISNKMKSVTACNDSLNSRTSNVNDVCATCKKCLVDSDYFACVTKMLNDVNARTKKPNVVPISTRKPKGHANKSVATPYKKKVASKSTNQKPQSYYRMLYEKTNLYTISLQELTSSTPLCLMAKASPTQAWLWHRRLSHLNFDYINLLSKKDVVIGLPKLKFIKDQLCSSCELSKAKRSSFKSKAVPSSKGRLNLLHMDLCGPMRIASINGKKYILPEWSRFVRIVKQQHKLDEVSYHKLYDILKQYQNEVNELCAERLDRNANPLALVATAQANQDPYYQTSNDPEQAQRDKDMQKNLALIAKYFIKIHKPTNNNLRTSSNSRNKNVDTTTRRFLLLTQAPILSHWNSNTCLVETDDSNVIPDSTNMCDDDIQHDQNDVESDDKRVALANLIGNLKLDVDENKKIQKQLKKANTTLAQELKECKTIVAETSKTIRESNSVQDSCLVAFQNKQTEFEKYKAFNDRTIDYDKLKRKLNKTLGQFAQKDIEIKEGLKTKAYEILVVKEKHDELIKQNLLTKSHYEGLVKQKTKVITDLKLREEHDIDKMLSIEKQLKFLNKIIYKRSQSIQTIHMMAPKVPTYDGRSTFVNPRYFKQAQSKIPCLYAFAYDQSIHVNRLIPDGEETLALERESRSKLNKDLVRPYDYTTLNSLYEFFKPPTHEYEIQLAHANEIRKKMWQKSFVKYKPNIFKNIGFLPVSKSISKSRQAYNVVKNKINHFQEIVDNAWIKHSKDQFRFPTAQDIEILIQTCLMPLALKTQNDSFIFVHELKQEMHADLKYVEYLEKEINELESDKAEFSNMYDMILQEFVSNEVMCMYLLSLYDLDALAELQCFYIHKVKKCNCLAQKLLKQTEYVSKEVHTELLKRFAKVEKHSISLEIALQKCKEQTVRNTCVSTSTGVNHKTNVSRPQHRINQLKDKVVPKNSQVKLKKTQVEEHPRIPSISNKLKSVTACNDILNSRTSNVNAVCATCKKCLVDSDHFACVTKMLNDVNARTKKPNVVPISTRKPKGHANKSVATPHKKKVASKSTNHKLQSYYRMLYEKTSKTWKWWIEQQNPSVYKWVPKTKMQWVPKVKSENVQKRVSFAVDNASRITNCNDLLIGNRGSDLYTISLQELTSSTPLCLMAKASPTQAWLWHRRLSHLNFDYINLLSKKDVVIGLPKLKFIKDQLCSSCELSKAKRSSFKSKAVPSSKGRLNLLHIDLCGPMRIARINGKKYILAECTRIEVEQFREMLLQRMGNVKKSVAEITHHKRQYDIKVNKRQMQMHASKVDLSKALDANLVVMKSNRTEFGKQDTSSNLGNYLTHVVDADIIPHHTEQSEPIYDTYLLEKIGSNTTPDSTNMSHRGEEIDQDVEQYQAKRKPVLQLPRNQSVVRQPNAFKSKRANFLKLWFASQVDVNYILSKPDTPHYFPKVQEYMLAKPHYVIAPGPSRNSQEESYGSNDMAHNHYLEEARKKTQERNRNSKSSSSAVHEKPNTPRSCLRWKSTGRIFKTVGLRYINSGLVQNSVSLTTYVLPSNRDYEILFQPLFDEHFNPPPSALSADSIAVAAPRPINPADSPSSTTIDQDVPSASTLLKNQEIQSQVTHQGVEEQTHRHQNAQFDNASIFPNLF
nr:retrovirus-related Pol polyprotein from transposon TNT 1-94 [Tanacetum cinerariifolium]